MNIRQRMGLFGSRFGLPLIGLLLVGLFSALLPTTFPNPTTALAIFDAEVIIIMLALAEMLVLVVGEQDLSLGYGIGLMHILSLGFIVRDHLPWGVSVVLVLLIGALIGAANAFFVTIIKINSFIATLGVGTVLYAISNWYTNSLQVIGPLPDGFVNIYAGKIFGAPIAIVYIVILVVGLWLILDFTVVGRYLYALGGNRKAAELSGIKPKRYIFGVWMAVGLIMGFAGIVLGSRLQIGSAGTGPDFLLPVFAGAMLGTTTIKPGRPNPFGTIVAVTVLGIGIAGFEQLGSSTPFIVPLFNGSTLLIGVGLAVYAAQRVRASNTATVTTKPGEYTTQIQVVNKK
jgi:ribose transport system permease protein